MTAAPAPIRQVDPRDLDALALLWRDGWRDAHAGILPEKLARRRTLASFRSRLAEPTGIIRVAGPIGAPDGFAYVRDDELYQFYVHARARGCGVSDALMADAIACFASAGIKRAWLACGIGNERAARFYRRQGWEMARVMPSRLDTPDGPFMLDVWRFERAIEPGERAG